VAAVLQATARVLPIHEFDRQEDAAIRHSGRGGVVLSGPICQRR
jgi:hypothetical protein